MPLSKLDILLAEGRSAVEEIVRLLELGQPVPERLAEFLANALRAGLAGDSIRKALKLKGGPGRRARSLAVLDEETMIAVAVLELHNSGEAPRLGDAIGRIAGQIGKDSRTVEGYLNKNRSLAKYLIDVKLEYQVLLDRARIRK